MPPVRNGRWYFLSVFRGGDGLIEVKIMPQGIQMHGHAGHRINGQDIVCAAVSALTCSLINSLRELTGDRIRADTASGRTVIEWQKLSDSGKLLVDSWFLALTDINREYNCICFL